MGLDAVNVFFSFSESMQQWELCEVKDRWNTASSRHNNAKNHKIVTPKRGNNNACCSSCISFIPFTASAEIFTNSGPSELGLLEQFQFEFLMNNPFQEANPNMPYTPLTVTELVNNFPRHAKGHAFAPGACRGKLLTQAATLKPGTEKVKIGQKSTLGPM